MPSHDSTGVGAISGDDIRDFVAVGVLKAVPGDEPVPVSIWRAGGHERTAAARSRAARLPERLAEMLLSIWTDLGQIVVDTSADPIVQAAAGSTARTYVAMPQPPTARQLGELRGMAALIVVRWPSSPHPRRRFPSAPGEPARTPDLGPSAVSGGFGSQFGQAALPFLQTWQDLLSPDGHTLLIVAPGTDGPYHEHAGEVLSASYEAGLGHLHHLVVITSESQRSAAGPDRRAQPDVRVELLILILRRPV